MPKIETFNANVNAPRADSAGSEAFELEGRHIESSYAEAGQALGRGIGQAGSAADEHETMVGTANILAGSAALDVQTAKDLEAAKTTMDPHDPNGVQDFLDAHQDAVSKLDPGPTATPTVQRMYEQVKANYSVNTTNKYLNYQSTAAANDIVSKFTSSGDAYANLAFNDPTAYKSSIQTLHAAAMAMPVEHREAVLNATAVKLADSTAEGFVSRLTSSTKTTLDDVDAARKYIADPANGLVQVMSPAQFASVNNRLNSIGKTQGNVQSVIAAQTLDNGYKQMEGNGGLDINNQWKSIIDNYQGATEADTAKWKAEQGRKYEDAQAYGQATAGVKEMPSDQIDQEIAGLQSRINNAVPDVLPKLQAQMTAITTAVKERDKSFYGPSADPAGYVTQNNEVVKGRYAAYAANPTSQNFSAYATASLAEQNRLYPTLAPRLVSSDLEQQISGALNQASTSDKGPAAVGGVLSQYAKNTGAYWPSIAIQLRQDKVISGNMGVGAELYGSLKTQALGETILQASALSPTDLKDKFGIPPDKAMVGVNQALKPLIMTMGNLPNADKLIADYRNAAVAAVQYSGDVNSASATVQKMLTNRYDIEDQTLRIPKSLGIDARRVSDGASAVRSDIGNHSLVLPPGFSAMNITPDRYAAQIKSSGKWFTNDNNTGALLYDVDGHNVQETKNGKVVDVELSWDALGQIADKQPLRAGVKAVAGTIDSLLGTSNAGP